MLYPLTLANVCHDMKQLILNMGFGSRPHISIGIRQYPSLQMQLNIEL